MLFLYWFIIVAFIKPKFERFVKGLPGVGVPENMLSNLIVSASVVLISVISLTNVGGNWAAVKRWIDY